MKELQEKLKKSLYGYNFKELMQILNNTELPEARETIMNVMEENFEEEFNKWLEEV